MQTRGGGGPKIQKFCGRHMCIAPKPTNFEHRLAEKAVPSMRDTLNLVRGGSEDSINCGNFDCSPSERPRIHDHDQAISRHMPVDIES